MNNILIGSIPDVGSPLDETNADDAAGLGGVASATNRCLNCGESLADGVRYCPMCGQPATTGRLRSRDLLLNSLGVLTRVNKGVVYTCVNLLYRPWKVIAGYIHGQRLTYTNPVQLLIGLCFIWLALRALLDLEPAAAAKIDAEAIAETSMLMHVFKFFAESDTLRYLLTFLPVVPVMMLLNRRNQAFRYNFAECFVGAVYMSDAMLLVKLLCLPLLALNDNLDFIVTILYMIVMGIVVVYKAFGHFGRGRLHRAGKVAGAIMLMIASYVLMFLILVIGFIIAALILGWDKNFG